MRLLVFAVPLLILLLNWLWPLPLPLAGKLIAAVLIVVVAFYHQWCRLSSGSVLVAEMPRPLIILFNWAFGSLLFLALLQLGLDLAAAVRALVAGHWVAVGTAPRVVIAVVAGALAAWGVASAVRVPPIRDVTVTLPGLDPALDGYCLVQLSDLHVTRLFPARWVAQVVARVNAARPDMVVVTGDFIDGSVAMRRQDVAGLAALQAPDGVFGVPGNHEYGFDYGAWMAALEGLGIQMLLNRHVVVVRPTPEPARLVIAGVTDRAAAHYGEAPHDLEVALAGCPPHVPIILLDHQPGDARKAARMGVALQLSGHTHGGMLYGLDRLVARGNDGFVSGLYRISNGRGGSMALYVSNGTGLWPGFALRLGIPPEITRFHLKAAG
ncbi:metallophosphoesterase [Oecophyllibacter saccharovorans]|uniref:Metallophosphoesterase n=1 Tax=Oecophyllibacter saccharovorans TaxID=2558360 RepID=A0A506UMB3_9PROT|nr:metallophosphoesterase [Oecophyllibacter saccharovorans]TPW34487.1 metallophosphoesterase [Oecophyllibacter saccharovorans]